MKRRFQVGMLLALLGPTSLVPITLATDNDRVDLVTTGSVPKLGATPVAATAQGSLGFRTALAQLSEDPLAAFVAARNLPNAIERRTLQWAAIQFHAGAIPYTDIQAFAAEAPDFAPASLFQTRLEQSLTKAQPAASAVVAALGQVSPSTVAAQILLAQSLLNAGQSERATALARQVWIENFLTEEQEAEVLGTLGALIDRPSHWARAMHLMMHDRAKGSERLLSMLTPAQQSLVVARAAVSRDAPDAKALLDKVDPSLHDNPVYLFSRAQRARQFELWQSAVDWLNKAPADLPDAAEWWSERRALMRQLLDAGEPKLAYAAAAGYMHGPEGRLVEARFAAGWIALSFLDYAAAAKSQFTAMTELATLPDTMSQANYWLARAELKLGETEPARQAFTAAASHPTVYYGQLAREALGETGVALRPLPVAQPSTVLFEANPVIRAVRLLADNGEADKAVPLLRQYAERPENSAKLVLAARVAKEIAAPQLAISIAAIADRAGTPLDAYAFPKEVQVAEADLAADRAAVFAIMRQESMFQLDAVSPVGARGLMQLMPGTAEEVAKKVGVAYSPSRLVSDGTYNALLGSTYLATQLSRYDGSLVLAAAAYNAGPGNANKWIAAYGDPREPNVDPVVWVELIPFQETRKYVQRVLGNYLVYREQLGESHMSMPQALRRIE